MGGDVSRVKATVLLGSNRHPPGVIITCCDCNREECAGMPDLLKTNYDLGHNLPDYQ